MGQRWGAPTVVLVGTLLLASCGGQSGSPTPSSLASNSSVATAASATEGEVVHGWPSTRRNAAGVYSWDGSTCSTTNCIVGFMHNGYGSGDVEIRIEAVPGLITDDSGAAVTVAGHEGTYRRIYAGLEEWIVDIEGTRISIQLKARPGTSATELAEAHAIIASMRTEPRNNALGFRLVFTLTTDDWDSG